MANPYISRGPVLAPAMFFGRAHALQEIAAFLNGNQSVSVIGPRKIGKTSLLFQLMRAETWPAYGLGRDNLFVYLDCEVLGEGAPAEILGQFALEIAAALESRGLPAEPSLEAAAAAPSRLAFETTLRRLNQRGLRVVLILDEFERLSTNARLEASFFNALRSAAGRYQLVFLTASAQSLITLTYPDRSPQILSSPFFNIFAPHFLGLLAKDEAHRLIRDPAQLAGRAFSPAMVDFIYALAGGHPLALQVACFYAFDLGEERAEVERLTQLELAAHFEYSWRNLSPIEKETLREAAQAAAREAADTTLRGVLRDLVQKCLLVSERGGYRYPSLAWASFVAAQSEGAGGPVFLGLSRLTGTRLGPYEVLERLGRGGMAEVYRGRHARLDRAVAIKVLPASLASEPDFRLRFEHEARAVAALKHPNIIQVFDFGEVDGMYYMVMEYIAGQNLEQYLAASGPLPLPQALGVLRDVASALDHAHAQGLVHRDIKPSNVMLEPLPKDEAAQTPDRLPFRSILMDFGVARILGGITGATRTTMLGTLSYMSPEQIRVARDIDLRSDVYALGVMSYEILTGRLPFTGDNAGMVLMAHLQEPVPDPRMFAPHLPARAARALIRALAKEREQRYGSAGEMVADLV